MPVFVAPAKINLFLHVVGRRADGYHLIQSAMQLIDLADTLTIEARSDGRIVRTGGTHGIAVDDDLAVRAARLLQSASGAEGGATIAVEKRIPIGGGLGGGSSDAATVLLALNRLWGLDWSRARLAGLGLALGADVPFFIGGTAALAEGIGERLAPLLLRASHYAIIHPGVMVPTGTIFGAPELTRDSEVLRILDFSESGSVVESSSCSAQETGERADWTGRFPFRNDLEAVAAARFEPVREALEALAADWPGAAGPARMSGSGACVFRPFSRADEAATCVNAVCAGRTGWAGWSVASIACHPHRECARDGE